MSSLAKLVIHLSFMDNGASRGLDKTANQLDRLNKKVNDVGRGMTKAVSAPIMGFMAASLTVAAKFEQQMSQLEAVLGADGTPETMEIFKKMALDASTTSVFSATKIAHAYTELSKAGVSATDIMDGAGQAALLLAHATGGDLTQSADIVAISLNQFALKGTEAMKVADVLTMSANTTAASVESLGQSLSYVGTTASRIGVSFEDTVAALGAMADAGIKGSRAGTNLNMMFMRIASPTPANQAAWEKLQMSPKDAEGNFIGLDLLLPQLAQKLGTLGKIGHEELTKIANDTAELEDANGNFIGKLDQANILYDLFGIQGGRAMAALLLTQTDAADAAGKSWRHYTEALGDGANGAAEAQSKILLDNLEGSFKKLKNSVHVLMIEIGLIFAPAMRVLADAFASVVRKMIRLPAGIKAVLAVVLLLVAAIGPLLIMFSIFGAAIASVAGSALFMKLALGLLVAAVFGASFSIGGLWDDFITLADAMTKAFGKGIMIKDLLKDLPPELQKIGKPLLQIADILGDVYDRFLTEGPAAGFDELIDRLPDLTIAAADLGMVVVTGVVNFLMDGVSLVFGGFKSIGEWVMNKLGLGAQEYDAASGTMGEPVSLGDLIANFGLIPRLKLEGMIINGWEGIKSWVEKKFFLGETRWIDVKTDVNVNSSLAGTSYSKSKIHLDGVFEQWAKDMKYIERKVELNAEGEVKTVRVVNWGKIGSDTKTALLYRVPINVIDATANILNWALPQADRKTKPIPIPILDGIVVDVNIPPQQKKSWKEKLAISIAELFSVEPGSTKQTMEAGRKAGESHAEAFFGALNSAALWVIGSGGNKKEDKGIMGMINSAFGGKEARSTQIQGGVVGYLLGWFDYINHSEMMEMFDDEVTKFVNQVLDGMQIAWDDSAGRMMDGMESMWNNFVLDVFGGRTKDNPYTHADQASPLQEGAFWEMWNGMWDYMGDIDPTEVAFKAQAWANDVLAVVEIVWDEAVKTISDGISGIFTGKSVSVMTPWGGATGTKDSMLETLIFGQLGRESFNFSFPEMSFDISGITKPLQDAYDGIESWFSDHSDTWWGLLLSGDIMGAAKAWWDLQGTPAATSTTEYAFNPKGGIAGIGNVFIDPATFDTTALDAYYQKLLLLGDALRYIRESDGVGLVGGVAGAGNVYRPPATGGDIVPANIRANIVLTADTSQLSTPLAGLFGGGATGSLPEIKTRVDIDVRKGLADMIEVRQKMIEFQESPINPEVDLNTLLFHTKFSAAKTLTDAWNRTTFTTTISGDNSPAANAIAAAVIWGQAWAGAVFTASFGVDTSGLDRAAEKATAIAQYIRDIMPNSPAKKGPLSTPISFSYIAEDLLDNMLSMVDYADQGISGVDASLRTGVSGIPLSGYGTEFGAGSGSITIGDVTVVVSQPNATAEEIANTVWDTLARETKLKAGI